MGRRQSAPRRQNTLEHGILDDGSLSPPSSFDLPDHSTLLSCLYQHLARLKLAHHGVTTRAILSRPISSAEHYDPFPLLLPCLFSLSLVSPICLFFLGLSSSCAAFRKRGGMLFSRHSRISSEDILHLDNFTVFAWSLHCFFFCFSIDALQEVCAIVSVVFSVLSWVAELEGTRIL
jgi:hypothetical protein